MLLKSKRTIIKQKQELERIVAENKETIRNLVLDLQDYKEENADLREDNINYRQTLRKILGESKKQQYGSVENLQAKIKELVKTAINN